MGEWENGFIASCMGAFLMSLRWALESLENEDERINHFIVYWIGCGRFEYTVCSGTGWKLFSLLQAGAEISRDILPLDFGYPPWWFSDPSFKQAKQMPNKDDEKEHHHRQQDRHNEGLEIRWSTSTLSHAMTIRYYDDSCISCSQWHRGHRFLTVRWRSITGFVPK